MTITERLVKIRKRCDEVIRTAEFDTHAAFDIAEEMIRTDVPLLLRIAEAAERVLKQLESESRHVQLSREDDLRKALEALKK